MSDHESREALRCEKCGGTDVYTRYRAAGETLDDGLGTARSYFDKIKEECLRRVCRTCGWKWVDPIVAPVVGGREAEMLRALAFAASCIKSGEDWTSTCEEVIGGALAARTPEEHD